MAHTVVRRADGTLVTLVVVALASTCALDRRGNGSSSGSADAGAGGIELTTGVGAVGGAPGGGPSGGDASGGSDAPVGSGGGGGGSGGEGGSCAPLDCAEMDWDCGTGQESACGTSIDCGACSSFDDCVDHQCCKAYCGTSECGFADDGCGSVVDCGDCTGSPLGDFCNQSNNICCTPNCTDCNCAGSCLGVTCGTSKFVACGC